LPVKSRMPVSAAAAEALAELASRAVALRAASGGNLAECFAAVLDPRRRRGIRHSLASVLVLCTAALLDNGARVGSRESERDVVEIDPTERDRRVQDRRGPRERRRRAGRGGRGRGVRFDPRFPGGCPELLSKVAMGRVAFIFWPLTRREEGEYPLRSLTDEQQRCSPKAPQPFFLFGRGSFAFWLRRSLVT